MSGTTVYSGIDAIGDRITTTEGAASVYLIPDLHGNVTATADTSSSPVFLSAYRYDAYGETCAAYLAGSLTSDTNPWRFQGRILQNTSGQTDLYDFGARSYDPSLGAFTSFDSVAGSAQNPLTLNRYLYALGNPETLVDPDGHLACGGGLDPLSAAACEAINAPAVAAARASVQCGGGLPPSMAQACETHKQQVVSNARATAGTGPTLKERLRKQEAEERARAEARAAMIGKQGVGHTECDPNPFAGNSCFYQAARDFGRGFGDGFVNMPGDTIRALTCPLDSACREKMRSDPLGTALGMNPLTAGAMKMIKHAEAAAEGDWYSIGYDAGSDTATLALMAATLGAGRLFGAIKAGMRGAGEEPLPPGWTRGEPSRPSLVGKEVHWYDPEGGEWRWHPTDPWHPTDHWDYKGPGPHAPWENR